MEWHGQNQPMKKVEIEVRNTGLFPVPGIPEHMLLVFLTEPEFWVSIPSTEELKFHTVLFSVYFVSVRSF